MATMLIPERLAGEYHGVTPPTLLPAGGISGGLNVRKVSQAGGWKARKGCALHNTTVVEAGSAIKSLHYYHNPFTDDEHFIAQANSKLFTETASNKLPPVVDAAYGTTLGVAVGTTPGFSCQVGEYWFYADGSGRPVAWGGTSPRIKGLFVYDISNLVYLDYTRRVTDGRDDTYAVILGAATDTFTIYTEERISGVTLDLGTSVNSNAVTLVVKAWRAGAWAAVSALDDGTDNPAGTTLAQDGAVSWTASANDLMLSNQGVQGYAYQFSWSGALSGSVFIKSITCTMAASLMTNKFNGEMNYVSGCRFYDQSIDAYVEALGKVTNESTSMYVDLSAMTTSDFLYLKTPEPATMFGFAVVDGYGNTSAALIDQVDYWDGDSFEAITTNLYDTTLDGTAAKSFSTTGILAFDASAVTPQRYTLKGDQLPGYWYRVSCAAALSANTRIYAVFYATYPETLPIYDGCVEFKNRLFLWGDPEWPNRLRFSARENPFCFSGGDSGYTDAFGAKDPILCAVKYYNELIVFKKESVWLLEGEDYPTFGTLKITDKVGLASPKSVQVCEVGFPTVHRDEPMTIASWQDVDGVYVFDGRKTKKASGPIDNYFNPESSSCIAAASIRSLQAFADPINNEYHLLLPSVELVYNYVTAEWYPAWTRALVLATGLGFKANDNREYCYAGTAAGWIMRLETDTTDKSAANADVAISHNIKTRAIGFEKSERLVKFTLRRIIVELKARSAGTLTTTVFRDMDSTGSVESTPQALSMVSTGRNIAIPSIDLSLEDCHCFEAQFALNTADQEMEIYSFYYEISGRGIGEQPT